MTVLYVPYSLDSGSDRVRNRIGHREVKEQYTELMKQSIGLVPDTSEYILHTAIIGWLNKEFNPQFETDLSNIVESSSREV